MRAFMVLNPYLNVVNQSLSHTKSENQKLRESWEICASVLVGCSSICGNTRFMRNPFNQKPNFFVIFKAKILRNSWSILPSMKSRDPQKKTMVTFDYLILSSFA